VEKMNKLKKYSFYIGIVGAILSCTGLVLDFFGVLDIMPIITEVVVIISTILVALGVVEKEDKGDIQSIKEDIKSDLNQDQDDKDKS